MYDTWDNYKRYINPYEFMFMDTPLRTNLQQSKTSVSDNECVEPYPTYIEKESKCISKYIPSSPSYFKIIEILSNFDIYSKRTSPICTFHLHSETSNASIQSIKHFRKNDMDKHIDMSMLYEDTIEYRHRHISGNKNSHSHTNNCTFASTHDSTIFNSKNQADILAGFTTTFPSISIRGEYTLSKTLISTGFHNFQMAYTPLSLCELIDFSTHPIIEYSTKLSKVFANEANIEYRPPVIPVPLITSEKNEILSLNTFNTCYRKYASSMDIIIADGMISPDYETRESVDTRLLFGQMCYAVCMQKLGGVFIMKISDCFTESTMDILYILCGFYENVYITKPDTSSPTNSEKYIVCRNFIFNNTDTFGEYIRYVFSSMIKISEQLSIRRFLNIQIPMSFSNKIEEINAILGQYQLDAIHQTILFIENKSNKKQDKSDKSDKMVKNSIQKCIQWCIKYNIAYHPPNPNQSNRASDATISM
jgi:23S rRNA U2552 (ribose-2'-O)-methylase RlmE/FtsJ